MSGSPPRITGGESSSLVFEQRQVKHSISKIKLKKRVLNALLDKDHEKKIKLRIGIIEQDREELKLENERLKLEKMERFTEAKDYHKQRMVNNKRIISLGDDLWSEKRKLRKIEEDSGKIAYLTPDSEGAFAAALLRLYKDPTKSNKRNSSIQSIMRADSIKAYDARPREGDFADKNFIRCSLSGEFSMQVRAAHIVPYSIGEELAGYLFSPDQATRLNRPDNCLMMNVEIERAFDKGNITLFPVDASVKPLQRWKIILVNQDARNQLLSLKKIDTLGELDGKEIIFRSEQRPASRFLYYHFIVSMLLCRARENPGWEELWIKYAKTEPWPTPGRYLRESMLSALARCVHIGEESEVLALGKDHCIPHSTKLNRDEEDEIARRMVEVFDSNNNEDEDEDEYEDEYSSMTEEEELETGDENDEYEEKNEEAED